MSGMVEICRVATAAHVLLCPGLRGTHLDHTLPTDERVDKLAAGYTPVVDVLSIANAL